MFVPSTIFIGCLAVVTLVFYLGILPQTASRFDSPVAFTQQIEPKSTVDPLTKPELPENPTQVELGRDSYFYNCMPCHGDQGLGLIDEWREVWVEDLQNCWAHSWHGNRISDEGFPIPLVIPAVGGISGSLRRFPSPEDLHSYLRDTHPPQRPGVLPEEDYWALTAFLLEENDQLPPGTELGPAAAVQTEFNPS